jgi:hypothetical protein
MVTEIQERNRAVLDAVRIRRDALYDAVLGLDHALGRPALGRIDGWVTRVDGRLAELRAALEAHVGVTEGDGGLFDQILDQHPRLAHAIGRLRREHSELRQALEVADRTIGSVEETAGVERARVLLSDLVQQVLRHRHRGAELVYEAYNVDFGTGD